MAGKILINYRRDDATGFTFALYQRLEDEFAADDLFMDVEGHIKPGDKFVEVLNAQVAAADVVLVVIGPRWAELLAARQNDGDDFVAIEIKAALDQNKRVIPVLGGGADMPRADTLPEAIRAVRRREEPRSSAGTHAAGAVARGIAIRSSWASSSIRTLGCLCAAELSTTRCASSVAGTLASIIRSSAGSLCSLSGKSVVAHSSAPKTWSPKSRPLSTPITPTALLSSGPPTSEAILEKVGKICKLICGTRH